jgi:hypothetical protein
MSMSRRVIREVAPNIVHLSAGDDGLTICRLYILGLPWQHHARTSALLGWVARDAEFLAERMSTIDSSMTASGAR